MRRPVLAAVIYLSAGAIAVADFDSGNKERPTAYDGPPFVSADLAEGSLLPATVELLDIPSAYTDGYGTYGGYRYAVVRGQRTIVDPSTRRVIGLLP